MPSNRSETRTFTGKLKRNRMAERVGFEPTSPVLPGYPLSRRALSTAQTPLLGNEFSGAAVFQQREGETSSSHGKKTLHRLRAFLRQHAAKHVDAVIQRRMAKDLKARMHGPTFGVIAAVDEPRNSRLDHRSRA